jgi:hypothetical protein
MKLNTVPVLVHQESEETAFKFFSSFKPFENFQPLVTNMLRVSDRSGQEFYKYFDLNPSTWKCMCV